MPSSRSASTAAPWSSPLPDTPAAPVPDPGSIFIGHGPQKRIRARSIPVATAVIVATRPGSMKEWLTR